jgi:hypothetical protein
LASGLTDPATFIRRCFALLRYIVRQLPGQAQAMTLDSSSPTGRQ